ncbi:ABC transporter ATP-binding protein [Cyclobacterium xiamenense]|uniref:ABC transporter ATP-binding protein n=1 Tax=Cyclobacterium xiamenense TaxID=1297121 RepID=UPI0012B6C89C|nr:ABC transporter ATP-binding protein [Cyclobacterium xiamenense]
MSSLKRILNKNVSDFSYFYGYLGNKLIISFVLNILVAILDGFGIAMFLPLMKSLGSNEEIAGLGKLSFILSWMETLRIPMNLLGVLSIMLFFFVVKGLVKYGEGIYKTILQRQFITSLRLSHVELLSQLSYRSFVEADSGKIQNTVTGEVHRVLTAYTAYFQTIHGVLVVMVYIVLAFTVDFQFTLLVVVGGLCTNFIYKVIYSKTKKYSVAFTESNSEFQGLLIQHVASFKYLKASGLINRYKRRLISKITDIEVYQKKIGELNAIINALREPLVVTVIFIVIVIEVEIFGGQLSLIVLSLLFFYRALTHLMNLQNYWNTYMATYGSLKNMKAFNQELLEGAERRGALVFEKFEKSIDFKNVTIQFNGRTILRDLSFSIKKFDNVAILGPSGSGKSTLMNMISGLIRPDEGEILLDGQRLSDFDISTFNSHIGYITQEPVIFDDTIFNNVTFWAEKTEENLRKFNQACRRALIDEFVFGLELQEDTRMGNNGIMVSGGQRQRIAIARELYKDIAILLMDEATSSLDFEAESLIQKNIEFLKGSLTMIIATHRVKTIENCNKVVSLKNGSVTVQEHALV